MKTWTPDLSHAVEADLTERIGYHVLGPVVHRWLLGLRQHLHFHDDGDTVALFCARAGVRIADLYEQTARVHPRKGPERQMFWISRVAVAKGVFGTPGGRARAVDILTREYRHRPLRDLVQGLMRQCPDRLAGLDLSDRALDAHGHNLPGWLSVDGAVQRRLRGFLEDSSLAFAAELSETLGRHRRALLIDSGWQGTAQGMLAAAFPDIAWRGLYVGRTLTPHHDPAILPDCIGLLFEAETLDADRPETAILRHRHLIESLLEPEAPSIEDVRGGPAAARVEQAIATCTAAAPHPERDALYLEVRRYVVDHAAAGPADILAAHADAMADLARMILRPRKAEVHVLAAKGRSADFGKPEVVPVILPPGPADEREDRIARALWPEGQIALELPTAAAREAQDRLTGRSGQSDYFDPADAARPVPQSGSGAPRPRVAVITRTRNRPALLRRAAESVAQQGFDDFVWTVVNDGGDLDEVAGIMRATPIDPRRMRLVSHERSMGMEAASNAGIAACDSDYVVIHDDDDSWLPEFLERTVAFLDSPAGARYGGVTTHSIYVSEEMRGERVIEHDSRPYNDWVRNVQLSEMACGNFFPPIAFVFRREVWDRVGGFNESLPVLGDWFFNMEMLLEDDIAVLPQPLARYHHRDRGDGTAGLYANSVIGGVSKHEEFAAVARNLFLRRHGDRAGIAATFALGYAVSDLRGRVGQQAEPRAAPPAAQPRSTDDRLWCVAEVNGARMRRGLWPRPRRAPLPADAPWEDIVARLPGLGARLRAPRDFDEGAYLRANPDVDMALRHGQLGSGYMHFVLHGRAEGRPRQTRADR